MNKQWKRLAALLGAAVLTVSQNEVLLVNAEELSTEESALLSSETGESDFLASDLSEEQEETKEEAEEDEAAAAEISILSESAAEEVQEEDSITTSGETGDTQETILPATNLRWDSETPGFAYFDDPNEEGKAFFIGRLYYNDESQGYQSTSSYKGRGYLYFFEQMDKTGTYAFEVETINPNDGTTISVSERVYYSYEKPAYKLPVPEDAAWSADGIFTCKLPQEEYFDSYGFNLPGIMMFGSNFAGNWIYEKDGYMYFNLNGFVQSYFNKTIENGCTLEVRTTSSNIEQAYHSDYISLVFNDGSGSYSEDEEEIYSEDNPAESVAAIENWTPSTPDEIKRYAAFGRENVNFTVDEDNDYNVVIQNAMQGKMCYDSFEAVLGDWIIGRTYNIFPSSKNVYRMDSKARITLNIPQVLQADGRVFKMICVTEKGIPIILEDLDSDSATITFETDTYYAFALIYKDI